MLHRTIIALLLILFVLDRFQCQFMFQQRPPQQFGNVCNGPNEQFNPCASTCPQTCDDYRWRRRPKVCNLMCRSGCECIPPYVRSHSRMFSACIHPRQCRFG